MVTPEQLKQYAEVMRETGLVRVELEGCVFVREVGASKEEQAAIDEQVKAIAESMKLDEEPSDPRENPLAYPDGRVPEFPQFDTSEEDA